tara:strand:+ start:153 stop:362 length:210 start_codon:yes stop_codon:yes gene_type:complete
MSIDNKFEEIVDFCLFDVDELGNDIILKENIQSKAYTDQMPPMVFPFGYMIISSTFTFFEEEDEDGDQE